MTEDLRLKLGSLYIEGWLTASFTAGIERFPRSFSVELTEKIDSTGAAQIRFAEGQTIEVYLGPDKVLTGYIDVVEIGITGDNHTISITGRSMCCDIVDCSAEIFNAAGGVMLQMSSLSAADIAHNLTAPYDITVITKVLAASPVKTVLPQFNINLGESAYQILERVARHSGFLIYDNAEGNLILGEVAVEPKATGKLRQGVNILTASPTFTLAERFGEYYYYDQGMAQMTDRLAAIPNAGQGIGPGKAVDPFFKYYKTPSGKPRNRKLIQIAEAQNIHGENPKQIRANWEMNRRLGRSQSVVVTTTSWRDEAGVLWQPNSLLDFSIPGVRLVDLTWVIADVTFSKSDAGTIASLTLMDKKAFLISPFDIAPVDIDRQNAINQSNEALGKAAFDKAVQSGA